MISTRPMEAQRGKRESASLTVVEQEKQSTENDGVTTPEIIQQTRNSR